MPEVKYKNPTLFADLVTRLREFTSLNEAKRQATNVFNRHRTKTCDAFKTVYTQEGWPAGTCVVVDGVSYKWDVSEAEIIDPRKWYALWKSGEISEDQFFTALSVGKEKAKLIAGEDQLLGMMTVQRGDKADIRYEEFEGATAAVTVITPTPVQPPKGVAKRVQVPAQIDRSTRRINMGRK